MVRKKRKGSHDETGRAHDGLVLFEKLHLRLVDGILSLGPDVRDDLKRLAVAVLEKGDGNKQRAAAQTRNTVHRNGRRVVWRLLAFELLLLLRGRAVHFSNNLQPLFCRLAVGNVAVRERDVCHGDCGTRSIVRRPLGHPDHTHHIQRLPVLAICRQRVFHRCPTHNKTHPKIRDDRRPDFGAVFLTHLPERLRMRKKKGSVHSQTFKNQNNRDEKKRR